MQLKTGEEYNLLQPVYSLNLVDDDIREAVEYLRESAFTDGEMETYVPCFLSPFATF